MTAAVSTPEMTGMPGMGGMGGMGGGATNGASMDMADIADAATKGIWELLPCDSQVLAVHAALLHTGKVLFFAGSGNDELYTTGLRSVVWDYENGGFHQPVTPSDVFCAHQSFLADGRLLVVGGTETYVFTGLRTAYAFDPATENWIRLGDMSTGRWYPVAVTLGDGRVLAAGGTGDLPHQVEIYSPLTGWAAPIARSHDWGQYPNLLLMRDGRVLFTGAHFDGFARTPFIFDVATHVETPVPGLTPADSHGMAPSVLLPPAQAQKAIVFGGGGPAVVPEVNLVDLSVAAPHFVPGPPMSHARMMQNAVILPDRTVFVSGGGLSDTPPISELRSEIYDPAANAWRPGATALVPRLYHSVALLLPDGRVITAGSNSHRRDDELRLELYHPPYLFKGPRPFIESAPTEVRYGKTIEIHTPQADQIKWVQLIRPMATTHSCDTEQRLVDLKFKVGGFCKLRAILPREANLAPPGWYMLFIVDHQGVPSVASWVHLEMDAQLRAIKTIKINSSIGIARVGNSPDEFFIGPEKPGDHTPPLGGYKDGQGRIKRQAARFRLFGYDESGHLVKEITDDDATISWTVHLANKKAEWKEFDGLNADAPRRNSGIKKDRWKLIIDPGPRTITGLGEKASFDTGKFKDTLVPLGEIRTDEDGRLLVLGGFGHSASPHNKELTDYANNDDWYDDVSDGPVNATITLHGGTKSIEAVSAWVIVAVPDFAPEIDSITTLYDTLRRVAVEKMGMKLPAQPSFTDEIYPILRRAIQMTWIGKHISHAHMTLPSVIPPPGSKSDREAIFSHLRNPNDGSGGDMPMLFSDTGDPNAALNRLQYSFMEKWKDGDFVNDWTGPPEPSDEITPEGLTRAALEACVGGAFYPGIEAGWFMRDVNQYSEPFRLDQTYLQPGDITKQMAVPWQADFYECRTDGDFSWWPAQRPDDVFVEGEEEPVQWTRKLVTSMKTMVNNWHRLGYVVKQDDRFVEKERT